jgi:hypothetical protein
MMQKPLTNAMHAINARGSIKVLVITYKNCVHLRNLGAIK